MGKRRNINKTQAVEATRLTAAQKGEILRLYDKPFALGKSPSSSTFP